MVEEKHVTKKQRNMAIVGLLMVTVLWGWGFIAGKQALETLRPFAILFLRFGMASALGFIVFYKRVRKADRATIKHGAIIGLIQVLALVGQIVGLQFTTTANQSFIVTTYAIWTPFMCWIILKKRPEAKSILAACIAIVGLALLTIGDGFKMNIGDLMTFGFPILFTLQIIYVGSFVPPETDRFAMTCFQNLSSAVVAFILCIVSGSFVFEFNTESLLGVLFLGIFNTVVAMIGQNTAQKYLENNLASLIMSAESVFGLLFSVLYYHTPITGKFLLGSALVFTAIVISSVEGKASDKIGNTANDTEKIFTNAD